MRDVVSVNERRLIRNGLAVALAGFPIVLFWICPGLIAATEGRPEQADSALLTVRAANDTAALDSGATVHVRDAQTRTASIIAARLGAIVATGRLLESGADSTAVDQRGRSALIHAARHGHGEAIRLLLGAGADRGLRNDTGRVALHRVAASGDRESVAILSESAVTIDPRDEQGATPLVLAIGEGNVVAVDLLLAQAAGSQGRLNNGFGAMSPASWAGSAPIVRSPLDQGPAANATVDWLRDCCHPAAATTQRETPRCML